MSELLKEQPPLQASPGSPKHKSLIYQLSGVLRSLSLSLTHTHVHTHAHTRELAPLDQALARIPAVISPESGTRNGNEEPRPFIKLIMNRP